jgi:hypothetical protein
MSSIDHSRTVLARLEAAEQACFEMAVRRHRHDWREWEDRSDALRRWRLELTREFAEVEQTQRRAYEAGVRR